ncbi:DUF397 domain-containing protein [Streptomyces sp. NPDC091289]|uniref:DUF397 domain-containing protein n=1 Tax=Streptomyces sp. NPDC091289 TaxID=3365989 RepID=UPI003823F434
MGTSHDLTGAHWRKPSYSGNTGGDCVEVATNSTCGSVPVRDSKNPTGPAIVLGAPPGRRSWTGCADTSGPGGAAAGASRAPAAAYPCAALLSLVGIVVETFERTWEGPRQMVKE